MPRRTTDVVVRSCRLPSVGVRLTETTLTEGDDLTRRLERLGLEVRDDQMGQAGADRMDRSRELVVLRSERANVEFHVGVRVRPDRPAATESGEFSSHEIHATSCAGRAGTARASASRYRAMVRGFGAKSPSIDATREALTGGFIRLPSRS
jgi:hypothetical protein